MYRFNQQENAVCDERGSVVLTELDWTIDKELYARFRHGDAVWTFVAVLTEMTTPDGRTRLGWEVTRISSVGCPTGIAVPTDAIARALKAFGYGNGRGRDDDLPVGFP